MAEKRTKCTYPMSEFYVYEEDVPKGMRVSTPEDCEDCNGFENDNCEDSKHCLLNFPPP